MKSINKEDQSYERLRTKEKVKKAQITSLTRNLEDLIT